MQETSGLSPSSIQAVCFDLCGTLINWNAAFDSAFEEAVGEWLGRWDAKKEEKYAWKRQALERYRSKRKQGKNRTDSLRYALSLLPIDGDERIIRHIGERIRALQPDKAKLTKGARKTLASLSKQYKIGVITNLDNERAGKIYQNLELGRYIEEEHLFCASGSVRKPSNRLYERASFTLGVRPQRCVMVGNSYRGDVAGALSSGWQAVWIRPKASRSSIRRLKSGKSVFVTSSLRNLPLLLGVNSST